jgi:hypothetical protein
VSSRPGPSYFFISLVSLCSARPPKQPFFFSRGLGWRMHLGVEVTELSTNKQHHLSRRPCVLSCFWNWSEVCMCAGVQHPVCVCVCVCVCAGVRRSESTSSTAIGGMRRSEEAKVSEEAVRRKDGGGGPRKLGMAKDGEAEEPV